MTDNSCMSTKLIFVRLKRSRENSVILFANLCSFKNEIIILEVIRKEWKWQYVTTWIILEIYFLYTSIFNFFSPRCDGNLWKLSLVFSSFQEHSGRVFRLQFDEFQIVSSSHDDTILIWDFLNYNESATGSGNHPGNHPGPGPGGENGVLPAAVCRIWKSSWKVGMYYWSNFQYILLIKFVILYFSFARSDSQIFKNYSLCCWWL